MKIYVLRHAIAEAAPPGAPDSDRALTSAGKKKLREVLLVARAAGVSPSVILTSPYKRAVETAEIAAEVLGLSGPLFKIESLCPGGSVEDVWGEVRVHKDAEELVLAGHEPQLSQLVAHLLGSPSLLVDMKKAALVCIETDQFSLRPRGVLGWMIVPKLAAHRS